MSTQEKVIDILKALNENRQFLASIYNIYRANFETVEMQKMQLFDIYESVVGRIDELKTLQANKKVSNTKLKLVKAEMKKNRIEFETIYNDFLCKNDDVDKLRKAYKQNVKNACESYKKLDVKDITDDLKKDYAKQVKYIKKVLDAIKSIREQYAGMVAEVEGEYKEFLAIFDRFEEVA